MNRVLSFIFLASIAFSADINFIPDTRQTVGNVKLGLIRGMRAGQLDDGSYIIQIGKAKTWGEARRNCQQIVPVGKWDLPMSNVTILHVNFLDNDNRIATEERQSAGINPMWSMNDLPVDQAIQNYQGTATVQMMMDGEGTDIFTLDIHHKKVLSKINPMSPALEKTVFKKLDSGLTTYCEMKASAATPVKQTAPAPSTPPALPAVK